jgi:hypothetical protein
MHPNVSACVPAGWLKSELMKALVEELGLAVACVPVHELCTYLEVSCPSACCARAGCAVEPATAGSIRRLWLIWASTHSVPALLCHCLQAALKSELMKALVEEQQRSVVHKVCDTVSELAADCLDKGAWPEVLPALQVREQGVLCVPKEAATQQDGGMWVAEHVLPVVGAAGGTTSTQLQGLPS